MPDTSNKPRSRFLPPWRLPRLYLRVHLTVLVALLVFALSTMALWHRGGGPLERAQQLAGRLLQNILPPATAPAEEQAAALRRLAEGVAPQAELLAADGHRLVEIYAPMPPHHGKWFGVRLPDGRRVYARLDLAIGPAWLRLHVIVLGLALLIGLLVYPLVRPLTRRLERLQQGVERLGAGELGARVAVQGHDEVARLARSFNQAAARIEQLMAAHKRLLATASHELRTPLTRIQLALELSRDGSLAQRRAALERDIAELDALLEEMLLASRLDAVGPAALQREPLDLLALAAEVGAAHAEVQVEGQSLLIDGDARLLRRLLGNLLRNAELHGRPPVQLRIDIDPADERLARLRVWDAGPGVAQAQREQVFEPFFRGATQGPGVGLGLSLVRQIANHHGGSAVCEPLTGGGSVFVVRLPRA
ncbi:HAMP domain-containing sensor histidine kinase [Paucibacter sp. APW11]|uniref:histidine kinase n=1 Tax=Roseateles aquae TaxID=3077235 RepID=A0ABU3PH68_9BURK|nr:HAMP domain-containing sensor histidine kinase [Paucibacter sp. APW11]MDT9001909.1 HAMP domain-containing sensor histidine kinase [Paucibacter sp. APW11]